jgi:hypothetical protein
MENLLGCFESQAKYIKDLLGTIQDQQEKLLMFEKELLKDGASIPLEDE